MKVCLINADSTIPNLALMKISTFHKNKGDSVELVNANLPFHPIRTKKYFYAPMGYDKYYCSVIFSGNKKYIQKGFADSDIIYGGSGYSLDLNLPHEIDTCELDYSLYPDNDTSYGFISRGCNRHCSFCIVPQKEGKIHIVSAIDSIVKHNKVKFLDNNFLQLKNHEELLQELIDKKIRCQFNQGLDIRMVNESNSILLSKLRYLHEYFFAFDNYSLLSIIEKKLEILKWRKAWQFRFFIYCHPDMPISETRNRIEYLKSKECLVYFMRDKECWNSKNKKFYSYLANWCNNPGLFKKLSFEHFLKLQNCKDAGKYSNLYKS